MWGGSDRHRKQQLRFYRKRAEWPCWKKQVEAMSTEYDILLTHGRIVRCIENIDSETLRAIIDAEVPVEYNYLDAELGLDNID